LLANAKPPAAACLPTQPSLDFSNTDATRASQNGRGYPSLAYPSLAYIKKRKGSHYANRYTMHSNTEGDKKVSAENMHWVQFDGCKVSASAE